MYGPTHVGQIQGAAQLLTVIASAVGQWLFPVAKQWFGSYVPLLQVLAAAAVLFAVWVWLAPSPAPLYCPQRTAMKARQAVIAEPFRAEVREVDLPDPGPGQVLVRTEASFVSPGTELAVFTGTHQWLRDPNLPDWKFPFRPGYSAAGEVVAVGTGVEGWKQGDRVSYPGNHASAELLTLAHERGKLWRLPANLSADKAAMACVARYGLGASIRAGLTLGRSAAVLGLGVIGQFALRCLQAAGGLPRRRH